MFCKRAHLTIFLVVSLSIVFSSHFMFFNFVESSDRIVTSQPCEDPELYDPEFGPVDSDTIVLTSASSENLARGFRLDDSTWWDEVYSWPVRGPSDGCNPVSGRPHKSMPWIADTSSLTSRDIRPSISAVTGNILDKEGDCTNRYWDGGSSSPPWIKPDSFGGWAKPDGTPQGFSFSVSTEGSVIDTCAFANSPRIWSTASPNEGDNSVSLWTQIGGDPNYEPHKSERDENREVHLFSQGVSLFRNEFHLTQEQYDNIEEMQFAARADDWMRIYINGQLHSSLTVSEVQEGSTIKHTLSNPKDFLQAGKNVMAFQVMDKARWHEEDVGVEYEGNIYNITQSNAAGLWYEVRIVSGEPEEEPDLEPPELAYDIVRGFFVVDGEINIKFVDDHRDVRDGLKVVGGLFAIGGQESSIRLGRSLQLRDNLLYPTVVVFHDPRYMDIAKKVFGDTFGQGYVRDIGLK